MKSWTKIMLEDIRNHQYVDSQKSKNSQDQSSVINEKTPLLSN